MINIFDTSKYPLKPEMITALFLYKSIGTYVLYDSNREPKYVGRTKNLDKKLKYFSKNSPTFEFFSYWEFGNIIDAYSLASEIYHRYNFSDNLKHPRRPQKNIRCPIRGCNK